MLINTRQAIRGILALDGTIDPTVANAAVAMLENGKIDDGGLDKTVDGSTAASLLGISRRSLNNYVKRGLVRRIGGSATRTRERFSLQSVRDYLNGTTAA